MLNTLKKNRFWCTKIFFFVISTTLIFFILCNFFTNLKDCLFYFKGISNQLICLSQNWKNINKLKQFSIGIWIKPYTNSFNGQEQVLISKWSLGKEEFNNPQNFSFIDTSKFNINSHGFAGGAFDGRYIYLSPIGINRTFHGLIARYDTTKSLDSKQAWFFFDITKLNENARGFGGAVFDGRYVYFIPNYGKFNNNNFSGEIARYDTKKQLDDKTAWEFFNVSKLNLLARGFWGGVFDGKFIYLVPHHKNETDYSGLVVRYDTTKEFTSSKSWNFFDTSKLNKRSKGFVGAVFDGKYIYFIPNRLDKEKTNGQVTRYDTTKPFQSSYAWSFFDTQKLNNNSSGFAGAVFNGRYIYFVPLFKDNSILNGQITRYDTKKDLHNPSAWTFYDLTNLNPSLRGFVGAVFDGRFIYYIPFQKESENNQNLNSKKDNDVILVQYDTNENFISSKAYNYINLTKKIGQSTGFWGGLFDGRNVYLIPVKNSCKSAIGTVLKFNTSNKNSSFKLMFSQINQSGSFVGSPYGPRFDVSINNIVYSVSSNIHLKANAWYFIVVTFNGKSLKIYINGKITAENNYIPIDKPIDYSNNPITLGYLLKSNNGHFKGIINNFFISSKTLSDKEIVELYKMGRKGLKNY
jgi:hypothetical protein